MLKRLLCMLLVLVTVCGILPMTASAEELKLKNYEGASVWSVRTKEKEPNNSRSAAQFLSEDDNTVTGEVHCQKDPNDYFYININANYYLDLIAVSGAGGEKSTKFQLYSSGGTLLKTATYDGEQNTDDWYSMKYSLAPGKYYIRVSDAKNWVGYQFYFDLRPQLAPPTITLSNDATTGYPIVKWNSVSNANYYRISRSTSKTGTYKDIADVYSTSYTDSSAKAGTTYYYKVKAMSNDSSVRMHSRYSEIVSRACDLRRPTGVYVTQSKSSGKNTVRWNLVSGADKYNVYYATSSSGTYKLVGTTTNDYLTHAGATANNTYYYKVKAIDADKESANSAYSAVVSGRAKCARPVVTMSNVASTGKPKVTWKAITGATSYDVYRSVNGTSWQWLANTTELSYTDKDAYAGDRWIYTVQANGKYSETISDVAEGVARVCDLPRPTVTVKLNSSGKPKLSWEPVSGAIEYKVYRATSKDGKYTLINTTTNTSCVNGSAKAGTTYYYKVKAVHPVESALSAYSAVVYVKAK